VKSLDDVLKCPAVIMITGRRGSGKSATGYYILEYFHEQGLPCSVRGIPEQLNKLLPDWITVQHPRSPEIPDDSAIFIDEAALYLYAREFQNDLNKAMDALLTVSRHKNLVLVFATHFTRKIDINVITDCDILLMKEPGLMHVRFERRELRKLTKQVYSRFQELPQPRQKYTYVISDNYEGFAESPLPSFWNKDLSVPFKGCDLSVIGSLRGGGSSGEEKFYRVMFAKE